MDSLRTRIVTAKSLQPPAAAGSEAEAPADAKTPEGQLRLARYSQIVQRLQQEADEHGSDVMVTVQDREVSLAQSKMAEEAEAAQKLPSGGEEVQFGTGMGGGDWFRWVWSLTDWVDRKAAHPIVRPTTNVAEALTGDLRLALAADWGTGLYGAPKIANKMRELGKDKKFDIAMHLGDVYYSGTEKETEARFINVWPTEAATINRALNGNHEMYSGGFGYFKLILPKLGQTASYFAYQNENWLLVGLDTAYVDHDMDNTQVAWLNMIVNQAGSRRLALFSHQQLFSRLDAQGPKLQNALKQLLEDKRITVWYWGHEHQCVIYDAHQKYGLLGRCLGNGGIPEVRKKEVISAPVDPAQKQAADCSWKRLAETKDAPSCIALDGKNNDMEDEGDKKKFVPHGFMTLEFKGKQLIEKVLLSDGTELYTNTI
jgi:predicted phosphodiesterase